MDIYWEKILCFFIRGFHHFFLQHFPTNYFLFIAIEIPTFIVEKRKTKAVIVNLEKVSFPSFSIGSFKYLDSSINKLIYFYSMLPFLLSEWNSSFVWSFSSTWVFLFHQFLSKSPFSSKTAEWLQYRDLTEYNVNNFVVLLIKIKQKNFMILKLKWQIKELNFDYFQLIELLNKEKNSFWQGVGEGGKGRGRGKLGRVPLKAQHIRLVCARICSRLPWDSSQESVESQGHQMPSEHCSLSKKITCVFF